MPLQQLDHVLVLTDDLEATKAFCGALGLEAGERPPLPFAGYWLYLDGVPCVHLAERTAYEAEVARRGFSVGPAVDHVAFTGRDYEALAARVRAAGVEPVANTLPGGVLRQLFFSDPNGVRIELNVPAA